MKLAIIEEDRVLLEMGRDEIVSHLAQYVAEEMKMSSRKRAKLERALMVALGKVEKTLKQRTIYLI